MLLLVTQYAANQLRVIKEFIGNNEFISDLAEQQVIPWLQAHAPKKVVGAQQVLDVVGYDDCSQTDDGRRQLRALGLDIRPAKTNSPQPRQAAVGWFLGRINSVGKASITISREGCPRLRDGFLGEYKYKEIKSSINKEAKDEADKTHPYSDVHDALQYVAMNYANLDELKSKGVQYEAIKNRNMWV